MAEKKRSQEICTMLYWELSQQKIGPNDIPEVVKDTLTMLTKGGKFTLPGINKTLESYGWPKDVISEKSMQLLCDLITIEFNYSVKEHNVA